MAADLVSVVVPARNCERFLADAITSALDQGASPVEVIVVDDASQDGTRAVAERFGRGVRVERVGGVGPAAARNHGTAVARGSWLAFLDADDVWATHKLERQLGELAHRQADALALGHVRQFSGEWPAREEALRPPAAAYLLGAALIPRDVWERVGPLREDLRFGDFLEWLLRSRKLGVRELILPDVVLFRRAHDANMTRVERASYADYVRILKAALDSRRAEAG